MRKIIHILLLLFTALTSPEVFAGDTIFTDIKTDSLFVPKKVCSCQMVTVKNGPYDFELVGIFAEKTLEGKAFKNYRILDEYIRRERIYFRIAFLESMAREQTFKSANSCASLYKELKVKHRNLQMYNIIDVDALTSLARR